MEKIKTQILCSISFFFENRAIYEMIWKYIVQPVRPHMTKWRMSISCWIPKAININSGQVIFFNVHGTVHLSNNDHINSNEMQLFYILYLVLKALHVSEALCVHHQEHYKL